MAELAKVIPLFKDIVVPEGDPWSPYDVLTEEMQAEILDVAGRMEDLWRTSSAAEFTRLMASIKEQVAGWPDG